MSQSMEVLMAETVRESRGPHRKGKEGIPAEGPVSAHRVAKLYVNYCQNHIYKLFVFSSM